MFAKSLFNRNKKLSLQELIDLEWQVHQDLDPQTLSSTAIIERDRKIGRFWKEKNQTPDLSAASLNEIQTTELMRHWLQEINADRPAPTQNLCHMLKASDRALFLLATLLGYFSMTFMLDYDGSRPIDSMYFLGFFVFFQWLMMGFAAYAMAKASIFPALAKSQHGLIPAFSAKLIAKMIKLQTRLKPGKYPLLQPYQILAERLPLIQRYLLFRSMQGFSIAFLLGSLFCFLFLVTFSDLAFSWGTTLRISVEQVKNLIDVMASPWSWFRPEWVPSLEVLRETQYFRLENRYVIANEYLRSLDPANLGQWWTFLAMCLVCYAMLPRMVLWTFANNRIKTLTKRNDFQTSTYQSLIHRMLDTQLAWQGPEKESQQSQEPVQVPVAISRANANYPVALVLWRDIPTDEVLLQKYYQSIYQLDVRAQYKLDGRQKPTMEVIAKLGTDTSTAINLLVESQEEPGKAIKKLITTFRENLGPKRRIFIHPIRASTTQIHGPSDQEKLHWHKFTLDFQDPYLELW